MKGIVINLDSRPDRMEKFKENKFPFPVTRFAGIEAMCGEDGCTYSHLEVLSTQKEFPFVVFEDDCRMIESWDMVQKAMNQLPDDWDALWLGANPRKTLQKYSENLYRLRNAYCLHAVIYKSKAMVDYILKNHNTPSGKNLDIFYRSEVLPLFNCYVTYPICATQHSDFSDIAKVNTNNEIEICENFKRFAV